MAIIGRVLTAEEREKVKYPFSKNCGSSWDLKEVSVHIKKGAEICEKDGSMKTIKEGIEGLMR